jgi:hypothetical protein
MASNKSAYGKPLNQRNKSNGKSANANQALSGVTRFVHAEEAPTKQVPTLNVRILTCKRECRVIKSGSSSTQYKFSVFQGDTFHNEKEIKQRATNCVAYVVLGMVIYFSKHKYRGTRAWTGKSFLPSKVFSHLCRNRRYFKRSFLLLPF